VTLNFKENRLHDEKSFGSGSSNWPGHHDRLVHCMKMIQSAISCRHCRELKSTSLAGKWAVRRPMTVILLCQGSCASSAWTKLLPSEAEDLQGPANPEFDLDSPQPLSEPDLAQDQDSGEQLGIVKL
jgi:hypothetical protein